MEFRAKKTTAFYEVKEDRIRIDVIGQDGEVRGALLTRRLVMQLSSMLKQKLTDLSLANVVVASSHNEVRKTRSGQGQFSKVTGRAIEDEVSNQNEISSAPFLVTGVNFFKNNKGYRFIFKSEAGDHLALLFSNANLIQWIRVIYTLSRKANWAITEWPSVTEQRVSVQSHSVTLH